MRGDSRRCSDGARSNIGGDQYMRALALLIVALLLTACMSFEELGNGYGPDSKPKIVDPERFKVDPSKYPKFRLAEEFDPPSPASDWDPKYQWKHIMVSILPSDIWIVRHDVADRYIVMSESYNRRQCAREQKFAECYLYGVFLTKQRQVSGGWKLLRNPDRVVAFWERERSLVPTSWGNKGWEQLHFIESK